MKILRNLTLALLMATAAVSTGCVHRAPLTTAQTIQLNSAQAIAAISESNRSATQLVISLNASKVVSDNATRAILNYTSAVASATTAAVTIQQGGKSDAEKAAAVLDLMKKLKLPAEVSTFVNDPAASGEVAGVVALIRATISSIQLLTGGN